jgi:excisionase family DNA binding protein
VGKNDERSTPMPRELGVLPQQVLGAIGAGSTLTVSAIPAELTTSASANLIGVSRPTLMKMISAGELPAHKVGSHTRLLSSNVFDFLRARRERQRAAFDALRDLLDD